jgi:FkbM family methyltransferase
METTFELPKIRCGHRIGVGADAAYWFEMDHAGEGPRNLLSIFDLYLNQYGWDQFITTGMTCIDIGGHSGDTAIPMQYLSRGTVLSIEPNPMIKQYLDFACDMNAHLGRFVTAGEAVTTQDCDAVEILDHNNAMCNGGMIDPAWTQKLQQRMRGMSGDRITVPGLTLEHICAKYLSETEIENIGFIKTDTEGHDCSILESSRDFLDRIKPVIFTEWFFAYTDVESQKLFDVIDSLGYRAFYPGTLEPATVDRRSEDLVLIHHTRLEEFI